MPCISATSIPSRAMHALPCLRITLIRLVDSATLIIRLVGWMRSALALTKCV
jgi:hypothetical protein